MEWWEEYLKEQRRHMIRSLICKCRKHHRWRRTWNRPGVQRVRCMTCGERTTIYPMPFWVKEWMEKVIEDK